MSKCEIVSQPPELLRRDHFEALSSPAIRGTWFQAFLPQCKTRCQLCMFLQVHPFLHLVDCLSQLWPKLLLAPRDMTLAYASLTMVCKNPLPRATASMEMSWSLGAFQSNSGGSEPAQCRGMTVYWKLVFVPKKHLLVPVQSIAAKNVILQAPHTKDGATSCGQNQTPAALLKSDRLS